MRDISHGGRARVLSGILSLSAWLLASQASGGIIFQPAGLTAGIRWDAAAQSFDGHERSLQGGLRYSVQGGSYQAFRDQFTWSAVPSVASFQLAVEQAFAAWTSVDPVSGLGTTVSFVPDFATAPVGIAGFGGVDFRGAEIDLFAANAGNSTLMGFTSIQPVGQEVTLTTGVANYANSGAIAGVDIDLNNNAGASYTLDTFRRLLTHEIGHALGLGDVDLGGAFVDDNYSGADPLGTLTNSWAHLVNPLDPANSAGLSIFAVPGANLALPGIDILMESNGLGIGPTNPLANLVPLTNDEYGTRQYLYPMISAVPEPASISLAMLGLSAGLLYRRRGSRQTT